MLGKIAGGIIGFLVGGPLGAAGGAAIGSAIDGDFSPSDSLYQPSKNTPPQPKSVNILATHKPESTISCETIQCRLAGVTFDNRQKIIEKLINGSDVYLTREPNNRYDTNAIAVLNSSYQILGYIPKDIAARVASKMIEGKYLKGTVINKHGGNGLSYGLDIEANIPCEINREISSAQHPISQNLNEQSRTVYNISNTYTFEITIGIRTYTAIRAKSNRFYMSKSNYGVDVYIHSCKQVGGGESLDGREVLSIAKKDGITFYNFLDFNKEYIVELYRSGGIGASNASGCNQYILTVTVDLRKFTTQKHRSPYSSSDYSYKGNAYDESTHNGYEPSESEIDEIRFSDPPYHNSFDNEVEQEYYEDYRDYREDYDVYTSDYD